MQISGVRNKPMVSKSRRTSVQSRHKGVCFFRYSPSQQRTTFTLSSLSTFPSYVKRSYRFFEEIVPLFLHCYSVKVLWPKAGSQLLARSPMSLRIKDAIGFNGANVEEALLITGLDQCFTGVPTVCHDIVLSSTGEYEHTKSTAKFTLLRNLR